MEGHAARKASSCLLHLMILPLQMGCRANCNNSGTITLGVEFRQLWQENVTVRDGYQLDIDALQIQPRNFHRPLPNIPL